MNTNTPASTHVFIMQAVYTSAHMYTPCKQCIHQHTCTHHASSVYISTHVHIMQAVYTSAHMYTPCKQCIHQHTCTHHASSVYSSTHVHTMQARCIICFLQCKYCYSETCSCDHLYSETTSIHRPLCCVPIVAFLPL